MRRTHAPSKSGFKVASSSRQKDMKPFPEAARSTAQLIGLLSSPLVATDDANSNPQSSDRIKPSLSNECIAVTSKSVSTDKKFYNVVWGKQTKKKHKTWEGDGTVEICNDTAVLKDVNGAVLGRSSKFKVVLEEGSRAFIGSKEIEVVDVLNKENDQSTSDLKVESESNIAPKRPFKKPKMELTFNTELPGDNPLNLLFMPRPDYAHQWKYNLDKLPVHDVKLDLFLSRTVRDHQREGISFLYSCVTGIRNVEYNGAILADEMGLGKTLQCISLIWILLKYGPYGGLPLIQRVLIITPSSLVTNWLKEFKKWLGFERLHPYIINQKQKVSDFLNFVPTQKPVLIISYEMFLRQYDDLKKCKFQLLICDEGHRLKNNQIRAAQLISQLNIKRRIILTGTPVQNNLQEFFSLIDFVNPGILGSYQEFKQHFEIPIIESNLPECSEEVKELGTQRANELNHRTTAFILRRTQSVIDQYLPSKQECVILCSPSQLQIDLYEAVVSYWENSIVDGAVKVPHLSVITVLKKICNDPRLVKTEKSLESASHDDECDEDRGTCADLLDKLQSLFENHDYKNCSRKYSSKMYVLEKFLEELNQIREKVVLISYFTQTLDLLQDLCEEKKYSFLRLDGSTSSNSRSEAVDRFNAPNSSFFAFLLSAKAGGVGLNLVGASRLVLFDLDWNPASDLQAMSRIWRDGQKKNVYIYRFLIAGSIEERIYQRQISKTFLSDAVVDVKNDRSARLSMDELKDLFTFVPNSPSLTHECLECECEGCGVPENAFCDTTEIEEERTFQLGVSDNTTSKNSLRISELSQWEHYVRPISENILEELGLKSAGDIISFVFRNKSSS